MLPPTNPPIPRRFFLPPQPRSNNVVIQAVVPESTHRSHRALALSLSNCVEHRSHQAC